MSNPLEAWKQTYGISDDAHLHLLVILQSYGISSAVDNGGDSQIHLITYDLPGAVERPFHGSEHHILQHSQSGGEASYGSTLYPDTPPPKPPCYRCRMRKTKVGSTITQH